MNPTLDKPFPAGSNMPRHSGPETVGRMEANRHTLRSVVADCAGSLARAFFNFGDGRPPFVSRLSKGIGGLFAGIWCRLAGERP